MAFYGSSFIFDSIPSEVYDLRILNFESGDSDSNAGSESEIMETYVYRKSKSYYYGKTLNKPLEFDLTIGSFDPISAIDRSVIDRWLLGRNGYIPFQIVQDDLMDVVFNVMFTNASIKYVGNVQRAITLHGRCNAPWGFTFPRRIYHELDSATFTNMNISFYNDSDDSDYLYPIINFTTNLSGKSFRLTNYTDNSRVFLFSNLETEESIEVDNYRQIINSSTGDLRLSKFNKKWFRLLPGLNNLNIRGGISSFEMIYTFARKVGA